MKVGLALAGGGRQTLAYIGVMQALNDSGIKIDYISSTSSGSIFASLYAIGYTPQEMKKIVNKYYDDFTIIEKGKIKKVLKNYVLVNEFSTEGLIDGNKIENIINQVSENKLISNVEMPLAIIAVDIKSAKECIFLSKKYHLQDENIDYIYNISLAKAIRASMTFPGLHSDCKFDKYNFIDGRTKDVLPVKVLKDMGADFIIAVNFNTSDYEVTNNITKSFSRVLDIFSQKDIVNSQSLADLSIEINTNETTLIETNAIDKLINSGYDEMRKHTKQLYQFSKNKLN